MSKACQSHSHDAAGFYRMEGVVDGIVRIYPIGGDIEVLGQGRPTQNPDFLIL